MATSDKLNPVKESLDRVAKKQKLVASSTLEQLNELIKEIEECKNALNPNKMVTEQEKTASPHQMMSNLNKKLKESNVLTKVTSEHKEFQSELSKHSKVLDKQFNVDLEMIYFKEKDFNDKQKDILKELTVQHLYRQGKFQIADMLIKEANLKLASDYRTPFMEMFTIMGALKQKNPLPAIQWASSKRLQLKAIRSDLEFKLHKYVFIEMALKNEVPAAIEYAKKNFSFFADTQMKEIQKLMCCLLFVKSSLETKNKEAANNNNLNNNNLTSPSLSTTKEDKMEISESSPTSPTHQPTLIASPQQSSSTHPYAALLSPKSQSLLWNSLVFDFSQSFCSFLGFSAESPLHQILTVGAVSIPKELKAATLQIKTNQKYTPVENEDLPNDYKFHSIFSCPVSKEQTQNSGENVPMLLTCGHAISKGSMTRISRGGPKFKCPYCPTEILVSKAIQLHF